MFGPIYLIESINGDVLEIVRDTLTSMMPYIHEMLKNAEPDPYTVVNLNQAYENLDIAKENLVISIIAAVSGCLGAVFGYLGYTFSKKTAKNVVRVSPRVQRALCQNFLVDLYKNMMYSLYYTLMSKPSHKQLIALLLSDFNDIFHIEAYNRNPEVHLQMKNIKERMLKYNEYLRFCYNNPEQDVSGLSEKSFYLLLCVHKLSENLTAERDWFKDLLEKMSPSQKASKHDTFNYLVLKHTKNFSHNKAYFQSNEDVLTTLTKIIKEYTDFIDQNDNMKPLLNSFFSIERGGFWKNPICDSEYKDIFADLENTFNEYRTLMQKQEWTGEDAKRLFIIMLAINTALETRSA